MSFRCMLVSARILNLHICLSPKPPCFFYGSANFLSFEAHFHAYSPITSSNYPSLSCFCICFTNLAFFSSLKGLKACIPIHRITLHNVGLYEITRVVLVEVWTLFCFIKLLRSLPTNLLDMVFNGQFSMLWIDFAVYLFISYSIHL